MTDCEIKVEGDSDNSELEEGEIDEFLEGVPVPPQEQIRKEVINSPPPTAVEKTQRLIVFTPPPPSPRKDFNSESDGQEAEEKSAKEAAAHQEACHCRKIREENEHMRKELNEVRSRYEEVRSRYEEMDEFLQIQFGDKYGTFRKNKKNEPTAKPLILATSDKVCPTKQVVDLDSELERRLIPISKPKEKEIFDKLKDKKTKADVARKKPREISPFRESRAKPKVKSESAAKAYPQRQVRRKRRSNERNSPSPSRKRSRSKSSSQSQAESHSGQPKKARMAQFPKIQFDPTGLEGNETVLPDFKLCPLCPTGVKSEELKNHLLTHKGITNSCISCNLDFPTRRKLEIHFLQKHRNRCAKNENFKSIETIQAPFKEWLTEMADLAIPIKQDNFVTLEEIQEIPSDGDGWEVFVKSLYSEKDEDFLFELFEKFGKVENMRILQNRNRFTNTRKGFSAFVRMHDYGAAVQAIHSLNGYILDNEGELNVSFSMDTLQKLLKRLP